MGNQCFGGGDSTTGKINQNLKKDGEIYSKKIKILLLGAGESGKTTLFKQMKLLYSDSKQFNPSERTGFKKIIYKNIYHDMAQLLDAVDKRGLNLESGKDAQTTFDAEWKEVVGPEEAEILLQMWNDPVVQQVWEDRGDVQVQDAFSYYMEHIGRISDKDWEPSNQDILRARARTAGVTFSKFKINNYGFEMYDVGGQRTERKKWMHYFDGVTTVLFVAAISEYNQVLFEDPTKNRQDEAVELFKKQLDLDNFKATPFILFLNKNDLFREKITQFAFRVTEGPDKRNESFEGPHIDLNKDYDWKNEDSDADFEACYKAAAGYLIDLYVSQAPADRTVEAQIFPQLTNSLDSENIEKIMAACKEIILKDILFP